MSYDQSAFAEIHGIYAQFGTSAAGLSSEEAKLRLRKYGPDILPSTTSHADHLQAPRYICAISVTSVPAKN